MQPVHSLDLPHPGSGCHRHGLPSTSEVEGHAAEKKKGLYVSLAGGATWRVDMHVGTLGKAETEHVIKEIAAITR